MTPVRVDKYLINLIMKRIQFSYFIVTLFKKGKTNLTPEEKKRCFVWGRHYSMAGGVNLLGSKYNLPHCFSFHGSFYKWVPEFANDIVVIAISESNWEKLNGNAIFLM